MTIIQTYMDGVDKSIQAFSILGLLKRQGMDLSKIARMDRVLKMKTEIER